MDGKKLKSHLYSAGFIDETEQYDSPYFQPAEVGEASKKPYHKQIGLITMLNGAKVAIFAGQRFAMEMLDDDAIAKIEVTEVGGRVLTTPCVLKSRAGHWKERVDFSEMVNLIDNMNEIPNDLPPQTVWVARNAENGSLYGVFRSEEKARSFFNRELKEVKIEAFQIL